MNKYDDRKWSSSEFRLYASTQRDELEKEIAEADNKTRDLRVFKDQALNQSLIDQADTEGRADRLPIRLIERLRNEPKLEGNLRGSLLDRTEAKLAAKELAVRLEARAEMRRTQKKYDGLWERADAVSKLSKEEEAELLEELRNQRAACDAARESRQVEFRNGMHDLRYEPEFRPSPDEPGDR